MVSNIVSGGGLSVIFLILTHQLNNSDDFANNSRELFGNPLDTLNWLFFNYDERLQVYTWEFSRALPDDHLGILTNISRRPFDTHYM